MKARGPGIYDQAGYDVRFEWGLRGLEAAGVGADVIVVVDVLSFSTAVNVCVEREATVHPFAREDVSPHEHGAQIGALVAVSRKDSSPELPFSLSPTSLRQLPRGTTVLLPSPNGSTLSVAAAALGGTVIAGCLRNASAVARAAQACGGTILVLAAGERWLDHSIRPALEDLLGAAAILSRLEGRFSPEASVTAGTFSPRTVRSLIMGSESGRELVADGYHEDIALSTEHDVNELVPFLIDGAYRITE